MNPCISLLKYHHILFVFYASSRQIQAHSQEAGTKSISSGSRRGLLWHLRARQSRVGVFEVGPGHELHRMTRMMQEGLWAATQVSKNNPPTVNGPSCLRHLKHWESERPTKKREAGICVRKQKFWVEKLEGKSRRSEGHPA